MTNQAQAVQAILREIVNDLEKTSAGLAYISQELQRLSPKSPASISDAMGLAIQGNQDFYNGLRTKIDALK
jgi:hypothetical protein